MKEIEKLALIRALLNVIRERKPASYAEMSDFVAESGNSAWFYVWTTPDVVYFFKTYIASLSGEDMDEDYDEVEFFDC